jgi:hypothetical protein
MVQHRTIKDNGDGTVTISNNCLITKKPCSLTVWKEQYIAWQMGELAQNAFPTLTTDEREFLISGISTEGWSLLFGGEE